MNLMRPLICEFILGLIILITFPPVSSAFHSSSHAGNEIWEIEKRSFRSETPSGRDDHRGQEDFDVKFYSLALTVTPVSQNISGSMLISSVSVIAGLSQVTLDLNSNMTVDSIISGGSSLSFTRPAGKINVSLSGSVNTGQVFDLLIYYRGNPTFTGFVFGTNQGIATVQNYGLPFTARGWFPCKDDPLDKADSSEMIITVPDNLYLVSNGNLESEVNNGNGTKTFHWKERYPIYPDVMSVSGANYTTFSDHYVNSENDSMEVLFYVFPQDFNNALVDFNVVVAMLNSHVSFFGEYPFLDEKYAIAEFSVNSFREHQTVTAYGQNLITGNHQNDRILAHEIAHQWFGNAISVTSWAHIWLNEGFATYAEALWKETTGGISSYLQYMHSLDPGNFPNAVFVYDSLNVNAMFNSSTFNKGAWVLHMLRYVIGDSLALQVLRDYRDAYEGGNASTQDFQNVCENVYGQSLDWFFNQWVYEKFRPDYEASWYKEASGDGYTVNLKIDQQQTNTVIFKMPLDVVLSTPGGDTTIRVWDSLATQTYQFIIDSDVSDLKIDPDGWVLKNINVVIGIENNQSSTPGEYKLFQNYPNPFNPSTTIAFSIPASGNVRLVIYDILGNEVRTLINGRQTPGLQKISWDGRDNSGNTVSTGVYIYRITADGFTHSRRLVFIK